MKKNELEEIKKLDTKALEERIKKAKLEIIDLKMSLRMGKNSDLKAVRNKRRDIAQLLTVLNQKKLVEKLDLHSKKEVEHGR